MLNSRQEAEKDKIMKVTPSVVELKNIVVQPRKTEQPRVIREEKAKERSVTPTEAVLVIEQPQDSQIVRKSFTNMPVRFLTSQ